MRSDPGDGLARILNFGLRGMEHIIASKRSPLVLLLHGLESIFGIVFLLLEQGFLPDQRLALHLP
jgi:hypothetical protein